MNATVADRKYRNKIHPKKFALWISCASIMMMFTAFTSASIVRQAQGNWLEFRLPTIFFYNTLVMIASSLAIHGSYVSFKKGKTALYRGLLVLSFILGILFIVFQYWGWTELQSYGIELTGNPSGSFLYVISGVHAAHILGGLTAIFVALLHAFLLPHKVTPERKLRFELTFTYWHFVDVLWIFLLMFFVMQQS